ncbi:MAG: tetraspanin family protein [Muribaculaceae bacterium]|nr:tetraspanin family protein [Muribaculaceae bacterium]
MKGKNYLIAYFSALVIGILLLIYHNREQLYNSLVIAIGALVAIPSLVLMIMELCRKRPADSASESAKAQYHATNWATVIVGIAGLVLGVWMVCSPAFFIKAIIYTLGAILILVGALQVVAIIQASRPLPPMAFWFVVPVICLIAGVVVVVLGPEKIASAAGLVAGICLVVYAANGFAATGREARETARIEKKAEEQKI